MKAVFGLLVDTFKEWSDDHASRLAAALSFYTMLALAPLLLVFVSAAGLIIGQGTAQATILNEAGKVMGSTGTTVLKTMLENAQHPAGGLVALVGGSIALLFGALGIFGQIKSALDAIWEVKEGGGIRAKVLGTAVSFLSLVVAGIFLLATLAMTAAVTSLGHVLVGRVPSPELILWIANFVVTAGMITLITAFIFKVLPDTDMAWRDLWLGAGVTAVLFTLGNILIGLYLGHTSTASTYGAFGSLVVFLIWIYYSAQIFFFGAEFTQVYANRYGARVRSEKHFG